MAFTLFGLKIVKAEEENKKDLKTFTPPNNDDGAVTIQSGAYYGTYVDLDGIVRNEIELITRYREMSLQPELETAIDEIVNEAIVLEDSGHSVEINLDDLQQPDSIKKRIREEFKTVLKLLNFGNMGHELFRRWYVDGRLFYHLVVDENAITKGIQELRYIDPRRIRKIREIQKNKDPVTGLDLIMKEEEYYLYNERGIVTTHTNLGTKIAKDSIVNINSGLMDSKRSMVLSYLHKAIKPLNQLRMIEDAVVIYRLSRAPERRIFYIDVGTMPTIKAEQYLKDVMTRYRNKLVYDSTTGEIKDDRKYLSMLEDIWLPRREGGRGTEIDTLPGGENLGRMEDVEYFEKKLYKSLGVPISRLEPQQGFSLGRTTEITRDELKFSKFVSRLRNKFSTLFDDLLRAQLVFKKICSNEEWTEFKENIWYDFKKDNNFTELKEAELLQNRLGILQMIDPYVGRYYSMSWVRKNVLCLDEETIEEIDSEIEVETEENAAKGLAPNGQPLVDAGMPPNQSPEQNPNMQVPNAVGYDDQGNPVDANGIPLNPDGTPMEPLPSKFETSAAELEFIRR